jgi:hypothetical protein
MRSMFSYRKAAVERAMKVQEVILRAMAKKITWWQAAEIIGLSDRSMGRWRERYEEFGYDGLFDRRQGKPSPKRVPVALVEQVKGVGTLIALTYLLTLEDPHRFRKKSRRGLLFRVAARTEELGAKRTADAHQQRG